MIIFFRDLIITLVIIATLTYLIFRKKQKCFKSFIAALIFGTVVYLIFWITGVTSRYGFHTDINWQQVELVPLQGIKTVLYSGINEYAVMNILGNVLMFVPLGFLLPFMFDKLRKAYRTVLIGMAMSCLIETTQLFLIRGTDIDDVLLNVLGTILGYVAFEVAGVFFGNRNRLIEEECKTWGFYWIVLILIPYAVEFVVGYLDLSVK